MIPAGQREEQTPHITQSNGTCVTSDASVDLGIKLHHDLLGGLYVLKLVGLLYEGEERKSCNIHIVLNLCLTCKAGLKLLLSFDSVYGRARAAESVPAAASAYELITFAVSAMLSPLDADDVDADEKPITLPPSSSIAASKLRRVLVEGSKKSVASFLPLHLSE